MSSRCMPLLAFLISGLYAQTPCLSLSSAAVAADGTASLELSLRSASEMLQPASLQWKLQLPSSGISTLTVEDGPAATAAGKTVICGGSAPTYTCLAVGANAQTIANGVIAKVAVVLTRDVTAAVIAITNPIGASADGYFMSIFAGSGTFVRGSVSPDRRLRPPLKRIAGNRCFFEQ